MRGRYVALSILALGAGFAGGIAVERFHFASPAGDGEDGPKILYWVAPMDANFRKDGPGKSPMGMDLVPVYEGDEPSGDPSEVTLSPQEVNAIGVRTAVARVEPVAPFVETVGFVTYDEDATSHIHARIAGWVEDLRVRALGDPVREGEPLFEIYGPRQERESMDRIGDAAEYLRVTAPQSGVVTALGASDGMYLEPGVRAMSITDLSTVAASPALAMGEGHSHGKKAEDMDHSAMDHSKMDHSKMDGIHTPATINSIDGMTVNVTHPAIPDLKWPPMTMDLMLLDGAEVGDVAAGDEAMLMLEKGEDGMIGIRAMMPAE